MKLLLALTLMFTSPLIGQDVVTWNPQMGHTYQNGRLWFKAASQDDKLRISASVVHRYEWMEAEIAVANRTGSALDFKPNDCSVELFSPKRRKLLSIDPDRLSAWILGGRGQAVGRALDRAAAANLDNPLYGDKQRAEEARQHIREEQLGDQRDAQWVRENGLRTQTMEPTQTVSGVVFFQSDRTCARSCQLVVRVPVGTTVFEFPVTFQLQKKP